MDYYLLLYITCFDIYVLSNKHLAVHYLPNLAICTLYFRRHFSAPIGGLKIKAAHIIKSVIYFQCARRTRSLVKACMENGLALTKSEIDAIIL